VFGNPKKGEDVFGVVGVLGSPKPDILLFRAVSVKDDGNVWSLKGISVFVGANNCFGVVSG
jgi:hypothetical protein